MVWPVGEVNGTLRAEGRRPSPTVVAVSAKYIQAAEIAMNAPYHANQGFYVVSCAQILVFQGIRRAFQERAVVMRTYKAEFADTYVCTVQEDRRSMGNGC